jgi:hypothetical protein
MPVFDPDASVLLMAAAVFVASALFDERAGAGARLLVILPPSTLKNRVSAMSSVFMAFWIRAL